MRLYKLTITREVVSETLGITRDSIRSSDVAADIASAYLGLCDREKFICIHLNTKNEPCGLAEVSVGSLSSAVVHPREVFKAAILSNAAAVVLAHNHPSGNPTPSAEDDAMTKRLKDAGNLLGIQVIDHVVVTDVASRYYSYADNGWPS